MITKYKKNIFALAIASVALLVASCDSGDQEDIAGLSVLTASSPSITIEKDFSTVSGVEHNATYPFTLTLSEPQIADIKVQVFQSGGTATEGDDFTIDNHTIIIPAYSTSATGSITIIADATPEETETLSITVGDNTHGNTTFASETFDFTLENFVADELEIVFDWDNGDIEVPSLGGAFPVCPNTDVDVYVATAAGFDITNPWANLIADFSSATGDCPEDWTFSFNDFADGEYIFFTDLWTNVFSGFANEGSLAVTATFTRAGVFSQEVVQDPTQAFLGLTPAGAFNGFVAKVKIAAGKYTIYDYAGTELVTGKSNATKAQRPILNKSKGSSVLRK